MCVRSTGSTIITLVHIGYVMRSRTQGRNAPIIIAKRGRIYIFVFLHTYCRLIILNVIAARRPLKLDILSALLLYKLLFVSWCFYSHINAISYLYSRNLIVELDSCLLELQKNIELCSICTAFREDTHKKKCFL